MLAGGLQTKVALLSGNTETEIGIHNALTTRQGFTVRPRCNGIADLAALLSREELPVVLVDLDPNPEIMMAELKPLARQFPGVFFIGVANHVAMGLLQDALSSGFRGVLGKDVLPTELPSTLKRLNIVQLGDLFTVLSAGGGCGATTLAVNLANELQLATSEPTAIVDLDYSYGAVGRFIRLAEEYTIKNTPSGETPPPIRADSGIDLILNPADGRQADHAMLQGSAIAFGKTFHGLLSPASSDENRGLAHGSLNYANLDHALALCKQTYCYTVIDAPRVTAEGLQSLGSASAVVLVMLRPMVNDIRIARKQLRFLKEDVRVEHLKAVHIGGPVWQWLSTNTSKEVAKLLKDYEVCEIKNDFSAASGALNYGKPLSEKASRSRLRRDISRLAAKLAEVAKLVS